MQAAEVIRRRLLERGVHPERRKVSAAPTPQPRKITAVRILVAGGVGLLLYFAHVAFVPVALALLLALVLSGPVEALRAVRVPRALSAALVVIAIFGVLAALVDFVSVPAQQWFASAPHTLRIIERKIRPVEQIMGRLDALRNSAGNFGSPSRAAQAPTAAPEESAPVMLFDATRDVVLSTVTVIILTLFLLAGGPPMLARMTSAFASDLNSARPRRSP
jgi:predicted PurR-regulated permease PerM